MTYENQCLKLLQEQFPMPDRERVQEALSGLLQQSPYKIVVLDDDPTGVQTVHDVSVYTDWARESLLQGFRESGSMFFVLTNSRSFTEEVTEAAHREIAAGIMEASRLTGKTPLVISRGDSTLRGHYPLETETLRAALEQNGATPLDGEILLPFFPEGGRYTCDDVHYVYDGSRLVPAGNTEFAKDKTFGYHSSHLGEWVAEKTSERYPAGSVTSIALQDLRALNYEKIKAQLLSVCDFNKVIVNAMDYLDVQVFTAALLMAMAAGKRFLFRTAAAFTKVIGGITDQPLLTRAQLIDPSDTNGGLIIAGSHVKKTTEQLEQLRTLPDVEMVEFDQHLVLDGARFGAEIARVIALCEENIAAGKTTAVFTRRDRLDLNTGSKEDELRMAVQISDALTSIVSSLKTRPAFLIAKGGITSSDIGTKGLRVKKAIVMGQVRPGIPVWKTGEESRFPQLPYVIFPGNVGSADDLRTIVETLMRKS